MHPLFKDFHMIRHGESVANAAGYYAGHRDVALTPKGIAQAESARDLLRAHQLEFTTIVHSHLERARHTAQIINTQNLPMIEIPELAEHAFGDWQGQPWESVRDMVRKDVDPPNGETHQQFHDRILQGLEKALGQKGPVLVVCHGGIFRGLAKVFDLTLPHIDNCVPYAFKVNGNDKSPWDVTPIGS